MLVVSLSLGVKQSFLSKLVFHLQIEKKIFFISLQKKKVAFRERSPNLDATALVKCAFFFFFCESTLKVRVPLPQRPPRSLSTIPYGSLPPLEKMCHWNANPERRQNRGSHGRGTTGGYSQARGTANLLCSVRGQKEIFVCRHLVPDVSPATNCCVQKKEKKKVCDDFVRSLSIYMQIVKAPRLIGNVLLLDCG